MTYPVSRLDSLASLCLGKMLDKQKNRGRPRPYLRNVNVRWGEFDLSDVQEMPFEDDEVERYSVRSGDVVICEGGEPGRCAVWTKPDSVFIQKALHRVRCGPGLRPRFLAYWLRFLAMSGRLAKHFTGTTIHHLPGVVLAALEVPHPAVDEQDRVVGAIEAHFSRVDGAVASLTRAKANVKRARASVLKAAVEGRLVPTEAELARAEGRDYEPAIILARRLLDERRRRWAEVATRAGKYKEPAAPDATAQTSLPEGWCWISVDQLSWSAGYGTSVRCAADAGGPPVLRIPNVQNARIDLDDLKFATDATSLKDDGYVEPGDLLFVRTNGSLHLIGLASAVLEPLPRRTWFASYLIRLRLCGGKSLWRWTAVAWNGPPVRRYIERDAASSAGQFNVSLSAAAQYAIPLPPTAEQHRIVAEVDRRLSVLDALDATIDTNLARCARLRQSILKRAFEGRLVPIADADAIGPRTALPHPPGSSPIVR